MSDKSFDEEFTALWKQAWRVGYRVTGSRHDAEDVAAETLTQALASWQRVFDPPAWVARVAVRNSWKVLKRRRRQAYTATEPPVQSDQLDGVEFVHHLALLPGRQREVVALRYLADMTERSIAEHLGISVASVRRHHERGLGRIRSNMTHVVVHEKRIPDASNSKGARHVPPD